MPKPVAQSAKQEGQAIAVPAELELKADHVELLGNISAVTKIPGTDELLVEARASGMS